MKNIAYFDMFSGISGNMVLGAFLDAGINQEAFMSMIRGLAVDNYSVTITKVKKQGIAGTHVDVQISGDQPHRHLHHINDIIDQSNLELPVKETAKAIFFNLAVAEAKIHNTTVEQIHFHEVGAVDAIIDIVGAAWCLHELKIDQVYASPVTTGSGLVQCAHGMMPVPAPATQELLKRAITQSGTIQAELTTPTGAAIISTITSGYGPQPMMMVAQTAYGAGTMDLPVPNLLRLIVGTQLKKDKTTVFTDESVRIIETNIDDMNPEFIDYLFDRLLAAGALDVFYTNIGMKKNRPATTLTVITKEEQAQKMADIILLETTSIGIRTYQAERIILPRENKVFTTSLGEVQVKVTTLSDGTTRYKPEYEDLKKIAQSHGRSLLETDKQIQAELYGKPSV